MSATRLTLQEGTIEKGSKRQKRMDTMKEFSDEGWAFVEKGKKTFLRLWKTERRTTYVNYILQHTETYVRNERK